MDEEQRRALVAFLNRLDTLERIAKSKLQERGTSRYLQRAVEDAGEQYGRALREARKQSEAAFEAGASPDEAAAIYRHAIDKAEAELREASAMTSALDEMEQATGEDIAEAATDEPRS